MTIFFEIFGVLSAICIGIGAVLFAIWFIAEVFEHRSKLKNLASRIAKLESRDSTP